MRDSEGFGDAGGGDRFADQNIGLAGVRGRTAGHDGCGRSQVRPRYSGERSVAERRFHAVSGPGQERPEEFGVEPVAQDCPPRSTGLDQLLGGPMGEGNAKVVTVAGQGGHVTLTQLLERERSKLSVRAGHHDHSGAVSYRGSLQ